MFLTVFSRFADRNVDRQPEDVCGSRIFHHTQDIGEKCADSIYEHRTDELHHIISGKDAQKQRISPSPSVVRYGVHSQDIARPRSKSIDDGVHKKITYDMTWHSGNLLFQECTMKRHMIGNTENR